MGGLYYYGFDSLYLYLVVPAIIIALWSQIKVKATFSKYSAYRTDISGADAARRVLELNGVHGVKIERVAGNLTDHYAPRANTIRLSQSVCDSYSISAVGVAAHEAGHAVQYAKGYFPIKLRSVILPVCNLGSQLSLPLLVIGLIFNFYFLVKLGVLFFCGAFIFQLVTLPVEFNASSRAVTSLKNGAVLLTDNDIKYAKKVLTAAAMTYIAAALVSLAQLIRLIAITGKKR